MALSTNLEIPLLSEAMTQKTLATNIAIEAMEAAISSTLVVDTSAATVSGYDIVLPYDNTNELTDRSAVRCIKITLSAGATTAFDVIHPNLPHLFIIQNNTSQVATVKCAVAGTTQTVKAGAMLLLYCDGTNIIRSNFTIDTLVLAADCNFAYYGNPPVDAIIGRVFIGRDTVFAANFSGSAGKVITNPANIYTMTVWDDGTQIGTITISTAGLFTFATVSATSKTVTKGSLLELRGPATYDNLIEEIYINLAGTNTVAQ